MRARERIPRLSQRNTVYDGRYRVRRSRRWSTSPIDTPLVQLLGSKGSRPLRSSEDPAADGDAFGEYASFYGLSVDGLFSDHPDTAVEARRAR